MALVPLLVGFCNRNVPFQSAQFFLVLVEGDARIDGRKRRSSDRPARIFAIPPPVGHTTQVEFNHKRVPRRRERQLKFKGNRLIPIVDSRSFIKLTKCTFGDTMIICRPHLKTRDDARFRGRSMLTAAVLFSQEQRETAKKQWEFRCSFRREIIGNPGFPPKTRDRPL
jgi:hypothetical protein